MTNRETWGKREREGNNSGNCAAVVGANNKQKVNQNADNNVIRMLV